jgi:hypothetical protein
VRNFVTRSEELSHPFHGDLLIWFAGFSCFSVMPKKNAEKFIIKNNRMKDFFRAMIAQRENLARGLQYPLCRANPARPVGWRACRVKKLSLRRL